MSVSNTTSKAGPYATNGAQVVFPFAFKVFTKNDLRVVLTDINAVESDLVVDSNYTVSLNADQNASPGGTVTTSATYPTGNKITIVPDLDATQGVSITNFRPDVIEKAFDKVTILIQQLAEQVTRSVKTAVSSTTSSDDLLTDLNTAVGNANAAASVASASSTAAASSATASAASATAAAAAASSSGRFNRLINSGFAVDQLATSATATADDTYAHDCWYLLTQTASVQVSTQTDQENGTPYNIRITQNQAAAQRFGFAQILESRNCKDLRGKTVSLSGRIRASNSQAIRYAILEWTGTADTVTSDVVNNWASGTFTAGNFFLAANITIAAVGSITPGAAAWTDLTVLTGTLSSSLNNLIALVWTEATAATGFTLDASRMTLGPGSSPLVWEIPDFETTLRACQRYFEKSFNLSQAPGNSNSGLLQFMSVVAGSAITQVFPILYKVRKAPVPITVTLYNPSAANSQVRDNTLAVDCNSSGALVLGETGFTLYFNGNASTAAGDTLTVQWTASARL